jgi:hypothetical protein
MTLPREQDHRITLAEGAELTRRHRESRGKEEARAFAFGRKAFDAILAQPGCTGIRAYLARRGDGTPDLVLVGIDADGADLANGEVMDRAWPCPPFCPEQSDLSQ